MHGDTGSHPVGEAEVVRDAFEAMPTLLVALEGPDHRLVAANAVSRQFAARPDFIGKPTREAFPDMAGQRLFELLDRVYAMGEPLTAKEWRLQLDEHGAPSDGDLFIDFTLTPWRHADGALRGILVTQVDVTERVRERIRAERAADAAEQRYRESRAVVHALQRALLPTEMPVLPQVDLAGRYLIAAGEQAAGGDWFDAIAGPEGDVTLVVGDVVGHGTDASAAMGLLRGALAAQLRSGASIPDALAVLDRYSSSVPGGAGTTLCVAHLAPDSGRVTYCTAGAPPPLVVSAAADGSYLEPTGHGPLGTGAAYGTRSSTLGVEETLVLYSDGIIERPGVTSVAATLELLQVAAASAANRTLVQTGPGSAADRVSSLTIELLSRETGIRDDVTVVAAQRTRPHPPFQLTVIANAAGLSQPRQQLRSWLEERQVDGSVVDRLVLAAHEAITNAIEHAYHRDGHSVVAVDATLNPDSTVTLTVADTGTWGGAPGPGRGLGLALLRQLIDEVSIDTTSGTTVTLTHRLHRPAGLLAIDPGRSQPQPEQFDIWLETTAPPRLRVQGPVDDGSLDRVRAQLALGPGAGSDTLLIDLTEASLVSSSALQVFRRELDQAANRSFSLRLVAPPGSTAHHVLTLAALPIHTDPGPAEPSP